jgi:hypothetical protein
VTATPVERLGAAAPSRASTGRVRLAAGLLTLLVVAVVTLTRLLANTPRGTGTVSQQALGVVSMAALVGPGLAAIGAALVASSDVERVGLLSVGVFAILAMVSPVAAVPAAGALVGGGVLAIGARGTWTDEWHSVRRGAVVAVLLGSTALSLAGAMGVASGVARPVGSELFVLGLAGLLVFVRPGRLGWLAAGLTAAGVLYLGSTSPFVTGAVVLVAFAAVDVAAPVLVVGLAGAAAAVAGALREGNLTAAVGAGTLGLAGVPATPTRATAVVVALYVLVAATEAESSLGVTTDE